MGSAAVVPRDDAADRYEVRLYEPRDRAGVLALFRTVWGTDRSEAWFVNAYERAPVLGGSPMVVAVRGSEVVGARPLVSVPLRTGATDLAAVYLHNVMVHPDHRRRGVFTRMTARAIEVLADREVDVLFTFAIDRSAPVFRDLGFRALGTGPTKYLRLQRPGTLLADRLGQPLGRVLGPVTDHVTVAVRSVVRRGAAASTDRVDRLASIPSRTLVRLYEDDPPEQLHTRRTRAIYEGFERDPYWTYTTYLAVDGGITAALVVRTETDDPSGPAWIVDAVPPGSHQLRSAFAALLAAAIDDHRDAPAVWVSGPIVAERLLPADLLSAFGFRPTSHPLLSRVTTSGGTAFVYTFEEAAGAPWQDRLHDAEQWLVGIR